MPATDISSALLAAEAARRGSPQLLAQCLRASRQDTLSTLAALEAVLPGLQVPLHPELNPPLWELGHIGWFQQHWISRNPQRHLGWDADPGAVQTDADDQLYDSSAVPHDSRWQLKLPDADTLRAQLAEAQRDAERLDWIIEHRAYVVSDPDCCDGYWLNYARPDGTMWTQATEHETPRAAIDAAKGEQ